MDIDRARNEYKTKGLWGMKMVVVHYDRVSSDTNEQLNSLNNQNLNNEDYIRSNPNWIYGGRYVDEGITGISTKNRNGFNKLIEDAKKGLFDFIITKEISRFARNTLDSIYYTRLLLSYGVFIYFQNDNINTVEADSEFRLTIMASVAQEEVRKLSSRVKYGHRQAIKNGTILGRDIYGYVKVDKQNYAYDEKYKPMIEFIFQKYANKELSTKGLADELYKMGYRSFAGGKIDSHVIQNIIKNPKYKGFYCGKKVQIVDMFSKKQKFLDEDEWVQYESPEHIPPIVSEELWNLANSVYKERSTAMLSRKTSYKSENIFKGKIICENDKHTFWLKGRKGRGKEAGSENPYWRCSCKAKNGGDSCNSINIYEKELISIISDILKKDMLNDSLVDDYINIYNSINSAENYNNQITSTNEEINRLYKKKEKILDYNLDGKISDEEFLKRNKTYDDEITMKEKILSELKKKSKSNQTPMEKIVQIRNAFNKYKDIKPEDIDQHMVDSLFDKIYVKSLDDTHMRLTFVLNTGESEVSLYTKPSQAHLRCPGYMVKNIFPRRTKTFERHLRSVIGHFYNVTYSYSITF